MKLPRLLFLLALILSSCATFHPEAAYHRRASALWPGLVETMGEEQARVYLESYSRGYSESARRGPGYYKRIDLRPRPYATDQTKAGYDQGVKDAAEDRAFKFEDPYRFAW
jgi:hypothetical protein